MRIIERIQHYNPSFNAVTGDRVEIDETYFRDSYKGYQMDYNVTTNPIGGQPYERADHHHENRPRTQGPGQ